MIKAIAFDFGGVIELMDSDCNARIADYLKISEEDWLQAYLSFNYLAGTGQKTYQEVFAMTAKKLGASDEEVAHILEIKNNNFEERKLNSELIEIIKKLKENYKIALLSNNISAMREDLDRYSITDLFDEIIISAEVGFQKPQPEIFEILFKKLGVESSEVVFVDDSKSSLFGAEKIGYIPILFTDNENLKEKLIKLNIKL